MNEVGMIRCTRVQSPVGSDQLKDFIDPTPIGLRLWRLALSEWTADGIQLSALADAYFPTVMEGFTVLQAGEEYVALIESRRPSRAGRCIRLRVTQLATVDEARNLRTQS